MELQYDPDTLTMYDPITGYSRPVTWIDGKIEELETERWFGWNVSERQDGTNAYISRFPKKYAVPLAAFFVLTFPVGLLAFLILTDFVSDCLSEQESYNIGYDGKVYNMAGEHIADNEPPWWSDRYAQEEFAYYVEDNNGRMFM